MKTEELDYNLPDELVAQQPVQSRSESRLLVLERRSGRLIDSRFADIGGYLQPGDCLVLNDTKVLAARFFARRITGAKLEGLFLAEKDKGRWEVLLKPGRRVKAGEEILFRDIEGNDYCPARVVERCGEGRFLLEPDAQAVAKDIFERIGFPPLPPYIKRDSDLKQAASDRERYQTVYARELGAVAAPTAGLHFTEELIGELTGAGIKFAYITLHVGEGTFKPVTADTLEGHRMHAERFSIDEKNAEVINVARQARGRIVAVGTTSVRTLEAATKDSAVSAMSGQTELFIVPGYRFKRVDAMVTNFHLPRSTLLALVGAFAGLDTILAAYRHAVEERYRFYSYGDAMLIV